MTTPAHAAHAYQNLVRAVLPFYRARQYTEALLLVRSAESALDGRWRAETAHLAACLLALGGDAEGGFEQLRRASGDGAWWDRHLLEDDDDLAPVRELDGFAALVEESHARAHGAQGDAPAPVVEWPQTAPTSVLVALHGGGSDGAETAAQWRAVAEDGAVVLAPTSSRRTTPMHRTWPDLLVGGHDVERAMDEGGAPSDVPVVMGGFSAGARQAMLMTLTANPEAPQRFLVVCPAVRQVELDAGTVARAARRGVRGHLLLGGDDEATEAVARMVAQLDEGGVETTVEVAPGVGHDYPPDFAVRVRVALAGLLEP
jgi:predicted esterase